MDELCGEHFYVWNGRIFGICFRQLCILTPSYLILLAVSSYYAGFRSFQFCRRSKLQRTIIGMRFFISILFAVLSLSKFSMFIHDDLVKNSIQFILICLKSLAWIMHTLFIWKFLFGVTYNVRGPRLILFSFFIYICATAFDFYFKCHSKRPHCMNFFVIAEIILLVFYIFTLIPTSAEEDKHEWMQSISDGLSEQDPLINPDVSRYYGFQEEVNSLDLGTAEETSNFLKKLFFIWVNPLMIRGNSNNLNTIGDLFDLPHSLRSQRLYEKIHFFEGISTNEHKGKIKLCCLPFSFKTLQLVSHLHKVFSLEFYLIGILKFSSDALSFGGPLLLQGLLSFLESDSDKDSKDGYYYAVGLFLVTVCSSVFSVHYDYLIGKITLKMKASTMALVHTKTLLLNKVSLSRMNTGEIVNYLSTDSERIVNFCPSFHAFWSLPFRVIVALVLLYKQIQYSFLVGIAFLVIVIPINQVIAKKIARYSSMMMSAKDKRIKLMNEILSGIRTIKMNSWESTFSGKLRSVRHEEVSHLKKRKYLDALCVYFWATTPVLISFLSFTLYASLGNTLTASKVFTSIALFNMLIVPLNAFPWVIGGLVEAWISAKRVDDFLRMPNLDLSQYYTEEVSDQPEGIEVVQGVFAHSEVKSAPIGASKHLSPDRSNEFLLGPLNFKLKQTELLCVVGRVGSGKSTFLSSLLADTRPLSGRIRLSESCRSRGVGFVSQDPWVQQKTVQENILFGRRLNVLWYRKVLEACALTDDLEQFPNGDQTEIGDKGITLSGGQKARLALARAVYQDYDLYLMDDPLSAVDAHVAEHIFSNCIMGLLKNKTRVLCTHKLQFAEKADCVMVLSEGKVATLGPPTQALQLHLLQQVGDVTEEPAAAAEISKEMLVKSGEYARLVQEEEKEEGVVKLRVYKTYFRSAGWLLSAAVLLFCLLMQASRTLSDWWLSFWVSSNEFSNSSYHADIDFQLEKDSPLPRNSSTARSVTFYLTVYGGFALANSAFSLFRAFLFALACVRAAVSLHDGLVKKVMKASCSFFDVTPLGRLLNRFSSDVYCIDDSFPFTLNILLAQVFALVGCLLITCYGLPWTGVPILMLTYLYLRIQRYYRCTSRELKRLTSISLSPIYAHFSETLHGQSTIRAMASENRFRQENMAKIDCNTRACLSTTAACQWLNLRLQAIGVVIVTAVALVALLQRDLDTVDPGLVGLALSYALSVTALLNGAMTAFADTEKEIVSVERVMQYIDGVKTEPNVYSQLPPFAWPSHGVVTFSHVSLRYRPDCPYVLRDVCFESRPGEKIGVVGRTGSGKSSLVQVLFRMVDRFEGAVFVDGVNIANLELDKLRSSASVIPQHPFLFGGTVRENLDPLFLKSDSQILGALRECHMEDKVALMGGLDVAVGEQGRNFSAGERQLLCLARALLRSAKILCMDEATASVDSHTESLIRHTVRMAFRRSTLLVIAHRLETVLDCERVMVMREGRIVEMDKPAVLLADSNSEFYRLVYNKGEQTSQLFDSRNKL